MSRNRQNTASTEKWSSKGLELNPKYRDVKPEEVCVGSIVWLRQRRPNEEEITCVRQGHCSDDFKLLDNGYRHPVVVLKIWQRRGSTEPGDLMLGVSDLTTFKDTPFRKYINHRNLIKFEESIPILQPEEIANPNIEQLTLASGALDRKSYVRLQHLLLVSVKYLWMYRWSEGSHAYDHRLDRQSYEKVMSELGVDPDRYESTDEMINTGSLRNTSLAREEAMELYDSYRLQSEGNRNSDKGKGPEHKVSYTAGPSLADVNQHQEALGAVSNLNIPNPPVQERLQSFETRVSYNARPPEAPHQLPPTLPQTHNPYGIFQDQPLSPNFNKQTSNTYGSLMDAPSLYYSSGLVPAHQQAPVQPSTSFYSTPVAPCFPPAVENNFYFHGSTAYFDAPINPFDSGFQPRQRMQPSHHPVRPQFGGMGEGFHNENGQQTAQQLGQQGPPQVGQHWYQRMPQTMGQDMAQPVPLYDQMAERYAPNRTGSQHQTPPSRNCFRPFTPVTSTQVNSWSAVLPFQQHPEHSQSFQPRLPPPSYRNLDMNSFSNMNTPGPGREHGPSPRRQAPYPEPYISPHKSHHARPPNAHGRQEEDWY